jgi:hypothetical protein
MRIAPAGTESLKQMTPLKNIFAKRNRGWQV